MTNNRYEEARIVFTCVAIFILLSPLLLLSAVFYMPFMVNKLKEVV